jgi:hypothetical protein
MLTSGNEMDIRATTLTKAGTEVAAQAARAHERDTHGLHLLKSASMQHSSLKIVFSAAESCARAAYSVTPNARINQGCADRIARQVEQVTARLLERLVRRGDFTCLEVRQ